MLCNRYPAIQVYKKCAKMCRRAKQSPMDKSTTGFMAGFRTSEQTPFDIEMRFTMNAEKVNGVWEQRLRIHYNCVGTIEIPSALPLPTPDVSVNTRKGVVVNYAPCDVAI